MQVLINTIVSAVLIAISAELSKKSNVLSAVLISLPMSSILLLSIIYVKTNDVQKVSEISYSILWFVLPSLMFFIVLPLLLKQGLNYWISLFLSCLFLSTFYFGYAKVLKNLGILK